MHAWFPRHLYSMSVSTWPMPKDTVAYVTQNELKMNSTLHVSLQNFVK